MAFSADCEKVGIHKTGRRTAVSGRRYDLILGGGGASAAAAAAAVAQAPAPAPAEKAIPGAGPDPWPVLLDLARREGSPALTEALQKMRARGTRVETDPRGWRFVPVYAGQVSAEDGRSCWSDEAAWASFRTQWLVPQREPIKKLLAAAQRRWEGGWRAPPGTDERPAPAKTVEPGPGPVPRLFGRREDGSCSACGSRDTWRSRWKTTCRVCHPPAPGTEMVEGTRLETGGVHS